VTRLEALREQLEGGKSKTTIKLQTDNGKIVHKLAQDWEQLKELVATEAAKKKQKWSAKQMSTRKEMVVTLGKELARLSNINSSSSSVDGLDGAAKRIRERKGTAAETRRNNRRKRRAAKGELEEIELKELPPDSEQVQSFLVEHDQELEDQNEMLDIIANGISELGEIALSMITQMKVQDILIEEADQKMDKNIGTLKNANGRLKELLQSSGGLMRYCPMIICISTSFFVLCTCFCVCYQNILTRPSHYALLLL
jgi:hypothetical protein